MGTKMKGIRKGFNKYISQVFVVKEEEIQISGPTDVKHVAHIGWDGGSGSNPTWMDTFETGPNFAMTSVGVCASAPSAWTSQGLSQDTGGVGKQSKSPEVLLKEAPSTEVPPEPKKQRRKKKKKSTTVSSPKAGGVKAKSRKSKPKLIEGNSPLHIAMP